MKYKQMKLKSKTETIIVAHRGASHAAPENTIPSFKLAFEENTDFIEGDFWLTADNEIVCIHDKHTKRTAPNQLNLNVKNSTLRELKKLDFGKWKNEKFNGTTIPTLQEILSIIPKGKGLFIEIKDSSKEFFMKLLTIIEEEKFNKKLLRIIAFDPAAVILSKKYLHEIKCYWLYNWYFAVETKKLSNSENEILKTLKILGADGIDINVNPFVSIEFADALKENHLDFVTWTVDKLEDAVRLLTLGVDAITTNYPQKMRAEIKKYFEPNLLSNKTEERLEIDIKGDWSFYLPSESE